MGARSIRRWGSEGMSSEPHDERYWLKRAKEAQLQADQLTTPSAKRVMLDQELLRAAGAQSPAAAPSNDAAHLQQEAKGPA